MLTGVDIKSLVSEKSSELLAQPPVSAWAACASIWSRVFVLSGPGWMRYPDLFGQVREAFSLVMQRSVGVDTLPSSNVLLPALAGFDLEDDGSAEWSYMVDLIEMISTALEGKDASTCLETALRVYLEEVFNSRVRSYALATGRPISYLEAKRRIVNDPEWERAVGLVRAL